MTLNIGPKLLLGKESLRSIIKFWGQVSIHSVKSYMQGYQFQ